MDDDLHLTDAKRTRESVPSDETEPRPGGLLRRVAELLVTPLPSALLIVPGIVWGVVWQTAFLLRPVFPSTIWWVRGLIGASLVLLVHRLLTRRRLPAPGWVICLSAHYLASSRICDDLLTSGGAMTCFLVTMAPLTLASICERCENCE